MPSPSFSFEKYSIDLDTHMHDARNGNREIFFHWRHTRPSIYILIYAHTLTFAIVSEKPGCYILRSMKYLVANKSTMHIFFSNNLIFRSVWINRDYNN